MFILESGEKEEQLENRIKTQEVLSLDENSMHTSGSNEESANN